MPYCILSINLSSWLFLRISQRGVTWLTNLGVNIYFNNDIQMTTGWWYLWTMFGNSLLYNFLRKSPFHFGNDDERLAMNDVLFISTPLLKNHFCFWLFVALFVCLCEDVLLFLFNNYQTILYVNHLKPNLLTLWCK